MGIAPFERIEIPDKSIWRERPKKIWSFYCPLCKSARKVPFSARPGNLRHILQMLVATAFFTLAGWNWFDWKGIVVALPLWIGFEIFYRTRVRASVSCPYCGFDPFLYMVDVKRARQEVEKHWRQKFAERGIAFPEKNTGKPAFSKNSEASLQDGLAPGSPGAPPENTGEEESSGP